jgi:hypothetical protein
VRCHLGSPVACEYPLQIEAAYPADRLPGLEIAHIPHMLTDDEGLAAQNLNVSDQHLGLVFLTEHLRRLGMTPRHGVGAKLSQRQRLVIPVVECIQLLGQPLAANVELTRFG